MSLPIRYQFLVLLALIIVAAVALQFQVSARLFTSDRLAFVHELNATAAAGKSEEVRADVSSLAAKLAYMARTTRGAGGRQFVEAAQALLDGDEELLAVEIWERSPQGFIRLHRGVDTERFIRLDLDPDEFLVTRHIGDADLAAVQRDVPHLLNTSLGSAVLTVLVGVEGDPQRVVVADLHPGRLLRIFSNSGVHRTYLVDDAGAILLHPSPGRVLQRSRMEDTSMIAETFRSGVAEGSREWQGPGGTLLGGFARVRGTRLAVVSEVPRAHALRAVVALRRQAVLFAIATVLGALLVGLVFSSRLTRPLAKLEYAAGRIARGEFDHRIETGSRDEIGRLADAFMRMSRELSAREARLKETQAQLLHNDRIALVGSLAAGVAHEINNPLTYIISNLGHVDGQLRGLRSRVEKGTSPAAEVDAFVRETVPDLEAALQDALVGAERVRIIVADLKVFSHRQKDDQHSEVDLQRVADSAAKMVQSEIKHKATLVRDYGPTPPVLANDSRLIQVLLNLLVNAAQALPNGQFAKHKITIATGTQPDGQAFAEVRDTGPGIPADVLAKIFDPFFTTKPVGVGTGLGLSISHGIISQFGGTIRVETQVGKGTCFRIVLPAMDAENEVAPRLIATDRTGEPLPKGRILIVDDEPAVLSAVRRMLPRQVEALSASCGADAMDLLERDSGFQAVLCDVVMPGVPGDALRESVGRRHPKLRDRFIFMSGAATEALRVLHESSTAAFLEKPFDPDGLVNALRPLLERPA